MPTTTLLPRRTHDGETAHWAPFDSLLSPVFPSFNRLFTDFWGRRAIEEDGLISPALDVAQDEQKITVSAELPGLKRDDVNIQIENGVLTISGQKSEDTERKGRSYHRMERRRGAFHRAITLPAGVNPEKAEAQMQDGVLFVHLPLREDAKPKVLTIK